MNGNEREALQKLLTIADSDLEDVAEYFRDRSDVLDGDYGEPEPNKEMQLLSYVERVAASVQHAINRLSALPAGDDGAVAWMTHHDKPMLFPTRKEAESHCADNEQSIPLYTSAPAAIVDEAAKRNTKLLYAFMLECNVIGAKEAGVNLAHTIKDELAALGAHP